MTTNWTQYTSNYVTHKKERVRNIKKPSIFLYYIKNKHGDNEDGDEYEHENKQDDDEDCDEHDDDEYRNGDEYEHGDDDDNY